MPSIHAYPLQPWAWPSVYASRLSARTVSASLVYMVIHRNHGTGRACMPVDHRLVPALWSHPDQHSLIKMGLAEPFCQVTASWNYLCSPS